MHRPRLLLPCLLFAAPLAAQAAPDLVLKNATVMTASHGTIEHGSVWVHNGKIAGVGASVSAPAGATIIDATGKFITPGIIDPHSHSALGNDVNEATSPVTPSMMMIDAFDNTDKALYQALAGGVTTELLLHGSANMIGGQSIVIKNKFGFGRDEMLFPNAPRYTSLGVEAQEVVPIEPCSADRRVEVEAGMWTVEVVVVDPWIELLFPFF